MNGKRKGDRVGKSIRVKGGKKKGWEGGGRERQRVK